MRSNIVLDAFGAPVLIRERVVRCDVPDSTKPFSKVGDGLWSILDCVGRGLPADRLIAMAEAAFVHDVRPVEGMDPVSLSLVGLEEYFEESCAWVTQSDGHPWQAEVGSGTVCWVLESPDGSWRISVEPDNVGTVGLYVTSEMAPDHRFLTLRPRELCVMFYTEVRAPMRDAERLYDLLAAGAEVGVPR